MRYDTHLQDVAEIEEHVWKQLVKVAKQMERKTPSGNVTINRKVIILKLWDVTRELHHGTQRVHTNSSDHLASLCCCTCSYSLWRSESHCIKSENS